MAARRR